MKQKDLIEKLKSIVPTSEKRAEVRKIEYDKYPYMVGVIDAMIENIIDELEGTDSISNQNI